MGTTTVSRKVFTWECVPLRRLWHRCMVCVTRLLMVSSLLMLVVMPVHAESPGKTTQEWRFTDVTSLDIDCIVGEVQVLSWDSAEVKITMQTTYRVGEHCSVEAKATDQTVRLVEKALVNDPPGEATFTVWVPRDSHFQTVHLSTVLAPLSCRGVHAGTLVCFCSLAKLSLREIETDVLKATTAHAPITVSQSVAHHSASFTSSDGDFDISLDAVPSDSLYTALTKGTARISIPAPGEYRIKTFRFVGRSGKIQLPVPCEEKRVSRRSEHDTHDTEICEVSLGRRGPDILLTTGEGVISLSFAKLE